MPPKREIFSSSPVIWKQLRRRLSAVETHSSPDQGLLLLLPSATPKCFSCLCQVLLLSPKNATLASTQSYSKMLLLLHTPPSPHQSCLFRIHHTCAVHCAMHWIVLSSISTSTQSHATSNCCSSFSLPSDCEEYQMANATLATPKCYFCYCSSYMY